MYIEIEDAHGRLVKDVYSFSVRAEPNKLTVSLDDYRRWTRPTTRHRNWTVVARWIRATAPPVPAYVREALEEKVASAIVYDFKCS